MTPTLEGGDIFASGNLICSTPTSGFYSSNLGSNISRVAAGEHIVVNGKILDIKASLFIAGLGISLTSTGSIVITNPNGHQSVVPPHSTIDVSLSNLAQSMYPALLRHPTTSEQIRSIHFLPDPTVGMKRIFFGQLPDPRKRLVFNPYVMGSISMVVGSMLNLLGTKAMNTQTFLALLDGNAQDLPDSIVPANSSSSKSFLYFTLKDIDDETQEAEPHLRISTDMISNAITTNVGVISEHGPIAMKAMDILLDEALVKGTSVEMIARKSPEAGAGNGRISMIASTIQATDKDDGHILLDAEGGVFTNARIQKQEHFFGGGSNWSRI